MLTKRFLVIAALCASAFAGVAKAANHSSGDREALVVGLSEALCARPWTIAPALLTPFADCADCDSSPKQLFAARIANLLNGAKQGISADLVRRLDYLPTPPAGWLKCSTEDVLAELGAQLAPALPSSTPTDVDHASVCAGFADALVRLDPHNKDAVAARKACTRAILVRADADATAAVHAGQLDVARDIASNLENGPAHRIDAVVHLAKSIGELAQDVANRKTKQADADSAPPARSKTKAKSIDSAETAEATAEPEPEAAKPEPAKPELVKPEPVKPEPVKPEPVKPEPVKPQPAKTGSAKTVEAKPTTKAVATAKPAKPVPPPPPPKKTAEDHLADAKQTVKSDPHAAFNSLELARKLDAAITESVEFTDLRGQAGCALSEAELADGKLPAAAEWLKKTEAPDRCRQHFFDASKKLAAASLAAKELAKADALIRDLEKGATTLAYAHGGETVVSVRFNQATALLAADKPNDAATIAKAALDRSKTDAPSLTIRIAALLTKVNAKRADGLMVRAAAALSADDFDEADTLGTQALDLGSAKALPLLTQVRKKRETMACSRFKDLVSTGKQAKQAGASLKETLETYPEAACLKPVAQELLQDHAASALLDALDRAKDLASPLASDPLVIDMVARAGCAVADDALHAGKLTIAAQALKRAGAPEECAKRFFAGARDLVGGSFTRAEGDKAATQLDELNKAVALLMKTRPGLAAHGVEAIVGVQLDEATALVAQNKEDDGITIAEAAVERAKKHAPAATAKAVAVLAKLRVGKAAGALRQANEAMADGNRNDAEYLAQSAIELGLASAAAVRDRARKAHEAETCDRVTKLLDRDRSGSDELGDALTDALRDFPKSECLKKAQKKLTRYEIEGALKSAKSVESEGELCRAMREYEAITPSVPDAAPMAERLRHRLVDPLVEQGIEQRTAGKLGSSYVVYQAARKCSPAIAPAFDPVKALASVEPEAVEIDFEAKGLDTTAAPRVEKALRTALGGLLAPSMKVAAAAERTLKLRVEMSVSQPHDTVVSIEQVEKKIPGEATACSYERHGDERVWTAKATLVLLDGAAAKPLQELSAEAREAERRDGTKILGGNCKKAGVVGKEPAFDDDDKVAGRLNDRMAAQLAEQLDLDSGGLVFTEAMARLHEGKDEPAADVLAIAAVHGNKDAKAQAVAALEQLIEKTLQRSIAAAAK